MTGGHEVTLKQGKCILDFKRKYYFSQRTTITHWDRSSADSANISSVNMLQNKTNKYLRVVDFMQTKC